MYLTKDQIRQAIQQHPEEKPEDLVQEFLNQGHQIEGLNDTQYQPSQVAEFGVGAAKGLGRSAIDISQTAEAFNKINHPVQTLVEKGIETAVPAIRETNIKVRQGQAALKESLKPTNNAQKYGGYAETAAEVLVPGLLAKKAISVKNILKLNPEELKKIAGTGLEYLKEKSLRKLPIKGGGFTTAEYSMPQQIEQLTKEFKPILSKNIEKTKQNAVKLGKEYYDKTISLFEGSTKAINENKLKNLFTKAIHSDTSTTYASKFEKTDVAKKAIDGFMNKVKSGTNKGLEEARIEWRKELANADGKLSKANEKIHSVIKDVIKSTLPEEKQALYDSYKTKQAKLFDIQNIIDAKKAASVGSSKLKDVGKKIAQGAGAVVAYEGIKKLFK